MVVANYNSANDWCPPYPNWTDANADLSIGQAR